MLTTLERRIDERSATQQPYKQGNIYNLKGCYTVTQRLVYYTLGRHIGPTCSVSFSVNIKTDALIKLNLSLIHI